MADLKKAGINPILAGQVGQGASSPSISQTNASEPKNETQGVKGSLMWLAMILKMLK